MTNTLGKEGDKPDFNQLIKLGSLFPTFRITIPKKAGKDPIIYVDLSIGKTEAAKAMEIILLPILSKLGRINPNPAPPGNNSKQLKDYTKKFLPEKNLMSDA